MKPARVRDWLDVMEAARADARLATRVWYPDPRGELLDLGNGINAEVLIGAPAYQVSTGEIVGLGPENFDYHGQSVLTIEG